MALGIFLTLAGASVVPAQWRDGCWNDGWSATGPTWYDGWYAPGVETSYEPTFIPPRRDHDFGPTNGWCEPRIPRCAPRYDAPVARRVGEPCCQNPPRQVHKPTDRCGCGSDHIRLLTVRQGSVALVPSSQGPPHGRVMLEWRGTFYDGQAIRFASDCDFQYFRLEPDHGPQPHDPGPGERSPEDFRGPDRPGPEGRMPPQPPVTKIAIRTSGNDRETSLWIKRPGDRCYARVGTASVRCIQRPMPQPGHESGRPGQPGIPGGPRPEPVPHDDERTYDEGRPPHREPGPNPSDDRFVPRERFERRRDEGPMPPNRERSDESPRPNDPLNGRPEPRREAPPDEGRERLPNRSPEMPPEAGARPASPGQGDSRFERVRPRTRPEPTDGRDPLPPGDRPTTAPMNPPELPPRGTDSPRPDSTDRNDRKESAVPSASASNQVVSRRVSIPSVGPTPKEQAAEAEISIPENAAAEAEIPVPAKGAVVPVSRDDVRTWILPSDPTRIRVRSGLGSGIAHRSSGPQQPENRGTLVIVSR